MFEIFDYNLIGTMGALLDEARKHGASYYPSGLKRDICNQLSEEISQQGAFKTLHSVEDTSVIEDMQIVKIPMAHPRFSMVTRVGMELAGLVNPFLGLRGIAEWAPNQAAAHRYHAGSQALGAHRDFSSDELLIAVLTLRGEGEFELLNDDGSVHTSWSCSAGGLCLMRAPGLTDAQDDRPLHRVAPPAQYFRESLIYRQINWEREAARKTA